MKKTPVNSREEGEIENIPATERSKSDGYHASPEWLLKLRKVYVDLAVMIGATLMGLGFCASVIWVYAIAPNENYLVVKLIHGQFRAIVGLPAVAAMSFVVVWAFEVSRGPVELELLGSLRFKGAAGPVLFWILCFSAIGLILNLNWEA